MGKRSGICIGLLVVGVAAESAVLAQGQGQGRGRGHQAQIRFQAMDVNGDRIIQRSEWRGSARAFEVHDWNGDGVLSGDEVRIGARRPAGDNTAANRGAERDLDSPWYEQQNYDWTPEHFRSLDRDNNGRVTAGEWIYARETFRRIDHNGDNWISEAEFLGDQTVDDGAEGTEAPADLFEAIDVNNDGIIARTEWRWSAASFDIRDTNKDGRLSRDEFVGITSTRTAAYRAGYDRGLTEGRAAGREARVRNQGWDLDGQRELVRADSGYQTSMGPRPEYQAGYREGFRRGYREGWEAR